MNYEYRDSGIDWIGKVPKHWEVTSIKKEFQVIPSNVDKKTEDDEAEVKLCNYVDVYYNDFITSDIEFMVASATDNEISKFQLKLGDVLITKDSEDPFDIAVPAIVKYSEDKLLCGYHLSMIRSINNGIDGSYLFWALKDEFIASQLWREACGVTRWAIASRHIKNSTVPFPPKPEQIAIANYLDKACADIDRVVEIKRNQIENLQQQLKSIIHHTVTKGLNPKAEMKESSIDWIGKVPKHWKRSRIKDIVHLQSGDNIVSEQINDFDEFPVYGGNGLRGYFSDYTHEGEFVLIGRQGALCGNINYASGKFWATEHAVVATPIKKVSTIWLGEILRTMNLNQYSNSAAQPGLSVEKIKNLYFMVPPFEEQKEIGKFIEEYSSTKVSVQSKIEKQIEIILNYKKSLIHEVVTGKKQVV